MIERPRYLLSIEDRLTSSPVVALLGPRQCGKTTLAGMLSDRTPCEVFDLESAVDRARLENPFLALGDSQGLVVIDEIQRRPDLFETLRVLVDRPGSGARFLVLGSASPRLVKGASESLAGRISFVDLSGFDLTEVGVESRTALWSRGGFPRSFLAGGDDESFRWRGDFIRTFLERDIPQLGITVPAETLRRFWTMIAHYHGQVWNAAEFARSLGTAEGTARRYLDILTGSYMVRQLQPWRVNIRKRQVKSPKVYIRDTGVLHALLSLGNLDQLRSHPKLGASWESFVIEQVITLLRSRDVYFWRTHAGAELDLLVFSGGKAIGFEVKYADAPRTTRSMRVAIEDLDLAHLHVVYPGERTFQMDEGITCLSIRELPEVCLELRGHR